MWRFLNSVHRAFRHHVQKPRPSAGAVVEEEKSESDNSDEKPSSAHLCPYVALRQRVQKPQIPAHVYVSDTVNSRGSTTDPVVASSHDGTHSTEPENRSILDYVSCVKGRWWGGEVGTSCTNTGQEEGGDWWRQCHHDFWNLVQGSSCRVAEAVSLGSVFFWGGDSERHRRRARLLYRILFALPGEQRAALNVTSEPVSVDPKLGVASNDTAGTADDKKAKETKADESLESVFAEFHSMCQDYTAVSESLQGLEAWEQGDIKSGVQHLSEAAALGHASACFNMGLCYETGTGVDVDSQKAQQYYKEAAKKGHSMAMYNLGLMYFTPGSEVDLLKEGLRLMEMAAKQGLAEAQTYMGFHNMYQTQDLSQALHFFSAAAQQKHIEAQYFLGLCHEQGWGVEVNECRAAQLFSQAAAGGHELAMCCLAQYNERGLGGLPEDKVSAKDLYTKAADMGSQEAKLRLEEMLAQEKIDSWKKKVSSFQEKLSTFHQLYKEHHRKEHLHIDESSPRHPLSPSASSPNLTDHKDRDYFFQDQVSNQKNKKDFKLKVSFDPGGKVSGKIHFTLGESLELLNEDLETDVYSSHDMTHDTSHDSCHSGSGDEAPFSVAAFHKSNTLPNLAIA